MLILPGDPEFDLTLFLAPPPDWRETADRVGEQVCFVASAGSGILRPADPNEVEEYLLGGEYDEMMGDYDDLDDDWL